VTPNSNYCVAGYGAEATWQGNGEGTYGWGPRVIQSPADWERLRPLDPNAGLLGEVLEANRMIGEAVGETKPYITTIFHPLAQAKNLAGDRLLADLRQFPRAVKAGLHVITESILRFIRALKQTKCAGCANGRRWCAARQKVCVPKRCALLPPPRAAVLF
jgi:uroporphyrinogen decarboxylase